MKLRDTAANGEDGDVREEVQWCYDRVLDLRLQGKQRMHRHDGEQMVCSRDVTVLSLQLFTRRLVGQTSAPWQNGLHVYDVASIMKAKLSAYLKTDAIDGI